MHVFAYNLVLQSKISYSNFKTMQPIHVPAFAGPTDFCYDKRGQQLKLNRFANSIISWIEKVKSCEKVLK